MQERDEQLSIGARYAVVAIAIFQGLLLLCGIRTWGDLPWNDIRFMTGWFAFALLTPGFLLLTLRRLNDPALWMVTAVLTLFWLAMAGYVSSQCDGSQVRCAPVIGPYVIAQALAWFVLLPFTQISLEIRRLQWPYVALYKYSWDNFHILLLAGLITGLFWLLLGLWAGLFVIIGIDFFAEIFKQPEFIFPVSGLVFGWAISTCRIQPSWLATARRQQLAVFKGLLPLLAFIAVIFLVALPFTGLQPLWATKYAGAMLMWLMLASVAFLNAVFQDGPAQPPYPNVLRRLVEAAYLFIPIYAGLAWWALYLRVGQYGWTPERVYAAILLGILTLYALGYSAAVVRRHPLWLGHMRGVNVAVALVTVALVWLTSSPLLDASRISVNSQLSRLSNGQTTPEEFDLNFLRNKSGRVGYEALLAVQTNPLIADRPEMSEKIKLLLTEQNAKKTLATLDAAKLAGKFIVRPEGASVPGDLWFHLKAQQAWWLERCLLARPACMVIVADIGPTPGPEYVLLIGASGSYPVFSKQGDKWREVAHVYGSTHPQGATGDIEAALRGELKTLESEWRDLELGGQRLRVSVYGYPKGKLAVEKPSNSETLKPRIEIKCRQLKDTIRCE